eukprot:11676749-Ditylum_brightwellii.AAC.1
MLAINKQGLTESTLNQLPGQGSLALAFSEWRCVGAKSRTTGGKCNERQRHFCVSAPKSSHDT